MIDYGADLQRAYDDGIRKGYENALRNYRHLILRLWRPTSEKPDKPGQYLCTLWDANGTFLAITEWNDTFGGRWQAVFEGEDSYSDIGNVLAWMPLPEPYDAGDIKTERKPQTNADRVRAMTDEELAKMLPSKSMWNCPPDIKTRGGCPGQCVPCWLDWLKQEETE